MDNESTIEVSKSKHNFTILENKMLRDDSISLEARGLLGNLLSNDDGWKISVKAMTHYLYNPEILGIVDSGIGKDKIYRIMKELIAAGYMERVTIRESGRIKSVKYKVYGSPVSTELTTSGFAVNGSASYGNDSLLKNKQEEELLIKSNTSLSNDENLAIEEDLLTKPYTELEEMCKQLKDKGYIVVVNYWWQLTGKQVPQLQKGGGKTSFATKFAKHYKAYVKENPRFLKEIWSVLREFHFNILPIKPESRKTWLNIEFILGPGKPGKGPGWLRLADKESFFYFPENGVSPKADVQPLYYTP